MKFIVGLGNPDEEYKGSRHNVGFEVVQNFAELHDFSDWKNDKYKKALISTGNVGKEKVTLILPQTYMNKSGLSIKNILDAKKAKDLIVIYDDLDLGIGDIKISFDKSSGGHKGLESIIKNIKTKAFVRMRIGISAYRGKKVKKPVGEKEVVKHVLGQFSKGEKDKLKEVLRKSDSALEMFIKDGREKMTSSMGSL